MKGLFTLILASFFIPAAHAAQSQSYGDVEIHYNAMPTDELAPEVAKSYKLERSRNRGLLTLSVLKKSNTAGMGTPMKAKVTASAVNLNGQLTEIDLREVVDGQAIYYLGEFRISPPETLKFNINATPAGGQSHQLQFSRKFYR